MREADARILPQVRGPALGFVALLMGTVALVLLVCCANVASLLLGVTSSDPLAYGGAVLMLAAVTLVASWMPARRASRVDPVVALKS